MEPFPYPWLFAVLVGAIILGVVIAYGAFKSSRTTRRRRDAARGLRDLDGKNQG